MWFLSCDIWWGPFSFLYEAVWEPLSRKQNTGAQSPSHFIFTHLCSMSWLPEIYISSGTITWSFPLRHNRSVWKQFYRGIKGPIHRPRAVVHTRQKKFNLYIVQIGYNKRITWKGSFANIVWKSWNFVLSQTPPMARDRFNGSLSKWRIYLRTMTKRMKKRIVCRVNIWVRIYQHIAVFTFNQVYETGS